MFFSVFVSVIVIVVSIPLAAFTKQYSLISHYCIICTMILLIVKSTFNWAKTVFNIDQMKNELVVLFFPCEILWHITKPLYCYPDMYTQLKGALSVLQTPDNIDLQPFFDMLKHICIDKTIYITEDDDFFSDRHISFYAGAFSDKPDGKNVRHLSYVILADAIAFYFASTPVSEIPSVYLDGLNQAWKRTHYAFSEFNIHDFIKEEEIDVDKLFSCLIENY